jgi:HAD superfamily hydrolase (TIGR01509 family)
MDGLLLDTERLSRKAWFSGGADLGVELPMEALNGIIGRRRPEVEAEFRRVLGARFPVEALYERHAVHYYASLESTTAEQLRKPGVVSLLDWLEAHSLPFAIATSTLAKGAASKLALAELTARFPIVVSGDQVERSKPSPDIFLEAASRLGVAPEVCVAFEDSDLGLEAAIAAGMHTIAVPDLKPLPEHVTRRAAAVLTSLDEAIDVLRDMLP